MPSVDRGSSLIFWKGDIPTSVKEKYSHSAAPTARKKTQKTGESSTPTALECSFKKSFQVKVRIWLFLSKDRAIGRGNTFCTHYQCLA